MKYIDAELLREKIAEQMESLPREVGRGAGTITSKGYGMMQAFQIMRSIIDTLQKEQPEQKKNCAECPYCIDRHDQSGWHFKGCFGGPYKGKFIAEIDECPLQQEQPEVDLEKVWDWIDKNFTETEIDSQYGESRNVVMSAFDVCKSDLREKYERDFGLSARKEE